MVTFRSDQAVEERHPFDTAEGLARLLSLLCGQRIDFDSLGAESRATIESFLRAACQHQDTVCLSYEEFNELLLLFNQHRVSRPFFDFFFLNAGPNRSASNDNSGASALLPFSALAAGVTRFRGFAMLCFGNFRFAFRTLSEEGTWSRLIGHLEPWVSDSSKELEALKRRQSPLVPLYGTDEEIPGDETWLLGYISGESLWADASALDRRMSILSAGPAAALACDRHRLETAKQDLAQLQRLQEGHKARGKRNTVRYLTWDYIDVYLATSMRQRWEYSDTHSFATQLFTQELADLPNLRWFDPTQSYDDVIVDKGLIEGLMLKRAKCTIYMAQETDTLGKDSELAATLAQGKPVIAYVRTIPLESFNDYARELSERPITYFRQRLLSLLAEESFFEKHGAAMCQSLITFGVSLKPVALKDRAYEMLACLEQFERCREFRATGDEEEQWRISHSDLIPEMAFFLAAAERESCESRATMLAMRHPLGMQVHLENGVANGVLVARTPRACAQLIRGILQHSLEFDISLERHPKTHISRATFLLEHDTKSRFRAVTEDDCLVNAFWSFYRTKSEVLNGSTGAYDGAE